MVIPILSLLILLLPFSEQAYRNLQTDDSCFIALDSPPNIYRKVYKAYQLQLNEQTANLAKIAGTSGQTLLPEQAYNLKCIYKGMGLRKQIIEEQMAVRIRDREISEVDAADIAKMESDLKGRLDTMLQSWTALVVGKNSSWDRIKTASQIVNPGSPVQIQQNPISQHVAVQAAPQQSVLPTSKMAPTKIVCVTFLDFNKTYNALSSTTNSIKKSYEVTKLIRIVNQIQVERYVQMYRQLRVIREITKAIILQKRSSSLSLPNKAELSLKELAVCRERASLMSKIKASIHPNISVPYTPYQMRLFDMDG